MSCVCVILFFQFQVPKLFSCALIIFTRNLVLSETLVIIIFMYAYFHTLKPNLNIIFEDYIRFLCNIVNVLKTKIRYSIVDLL